MFDLKDIYYKLRSSLKVVVALPKYIMAIIHLRKYSLLSQDETIDLLINNDNLSICRFGDGELDLASLKKKITFQNFDENLSYKLKEILLDAGKNKSCIICLPDSFKGISSMRFRSGLFWYNYISYNFIQNAKVLNHKYQYGNASITRPYYDYRNKDKSYRLFDKFKSLINSKKILIVEGAGTRLGMGNDLLSNVSSIKRITTLNSNAFSLYDEIFESILLHSKSVDMVLISLGPTATVLAYELSKHGVRCIDTGHIDIEYEWMLKGAKEKVNIQGKNVNESGVAFNDDLNNISGNYTDQILLHIGKDI